MNIKKIINIILTIIFFGGLLVLSFIAFRLVLSWL